MAALLVAMIYTVPVVVALVCLALAYVTFAKEV